MKEQNKLLDVVFSNIEIEDVIEYYANLTIGSCKDGFIRLGNAVVVSYEYTGFIKEVSDED